MMEKQARPGLPELRVHRVRKLVRRVIPETLDQQVPRLAQRVIREVLARLALLQQRQARLAIPETRDRQAIRGSLVTQARPETRV